MKRTDFIRLLERNGWWLERDKGPHNIYTNGEVFEAAPRHKELKEVLVNAIIKRRGLK
ncbi:MAG: type II toxin-antitoxin system HicA family toxin [Clostridiales bacterium]|jgi:predicted RNA binding protein YcfA (HicA-like mRNA interferase family)|nr:type II toxin-antitoxin system HicA family toxin [Clostridiales bacterium]